MFFARGVWCTADVSSTSPSSEQTRSQTYNCSKALLNTRGAFLIFGFPAE